MIEESIVRPFSLPHIHDKPSQAFSQLPSGSIIIQNIFQRTPGGDQYRGSHALIWVKRADLPSICAEYFMDSSPGAFIHLTAPNKQGDVSRAKIHSLEYICASGFTVQLS